MPRAKDMAALGRRGGKRGGAARAAALSDEKRAEIAAKAAHARWRRRALVLGNAPINHEELLSIVAHHGSSTAKGSLGPHLERVALLAIEHASRDTALARMLPVFLWRARRDMDVAKLAEQAATHRRAAALGYFLELTAKLGRVAGWKRTIASLRAKAAMEPMRYFFEKTAESPFEAMVAQERTPPEARAWGLITGTPTDSFESYFRKVARL